MINVLIQCCLILIRLSFTSGSGSAQLKEIKEQSFIILSKNKNICNLDKVHSTCFQNSISTIRGATVCPRSSDPFYIVIYFIKRVTISWTDGIELNGWTVGEFAQGVLCG